MKTGRWLLPCALVLFASLTKAADTAAAEALTSDAEPLDYTLLVHDLNIDMLRAGTHNAAKPNEYYFVVTMYGLLNSPEERNLDFSKRKKVTVDLGKFGDTKMEALSVWRPDEKAKDFKQLHIDGTGIRELVARTMSELQTAESGIMIQTDVAMMVRKKKFFFFGDDALVAKTSYYPIPATKFEAGLRTNQTLLITDDKGAYVKLAVRYSKPASAKSAKEVSSAK